MKSMLIILALVFSANAFAQDAPKGRKESTGTGEAEGAGWLHTSRISERQETVVGKLHRERAEAKRTDRPDGSASANARRRRKKARRRRKEVNISEFKAYKSISIMTLIHYLLFCLMN